ncbi:YgiQ family radical SAM protein [Sinanaerobacter chloroacetimidivorans]|uniref:YgiQ family radical SAM protein n=1 Tax=Sinanaerobacter chloroacetimidivorans TaxID=2818044 RepID=A0A8J8B2R6_9FIRM|nr:YgiQ family radical SAM protein [Sinanaerobacter chloroacetimidivorans]MBR0599002.1 YgiQ family radical SAM protein [Sinanaerobacter chloroacetimidivorans]
MPFLPVTKKEIEERGWQQPDFVLITGDAYVDHPSFGHGIISRVLESHGYKVAVLAQPNWRNTEDFKSLGKPRLGFLINSGNVDSMVNHYSVFKHRRKTDSYSPGGKTGNRPDRAVIVYSSRAREAYRDVPIIIGGLEASLRRFAHYDYWEDKVRRSILLDSKADLLIYGMGEKAVVEIAEALDSGIEAKDICWIKGTVYKSVRSKRKEGVRQEAFEEDFLDDGHTILLPAYQELTKGDPSSREESRAKKKYAESFLLQYQNNDAISGKRLVEKYEETLYVIQNPPQEPLTTQELDDIYELPYERTYHPMYEGMGGVPAIEEVKFSIISNRGCFGGCGFCALTYHQGREVRGRSKESILKEAERMTQEKDFKGYIHDVGGPTANFRRPACKKQLKAGVCKNKDCLYPSPCGQLEIDHQEYLDILRAVRSLDKVKKVFIRSGIRYDFVMADASGQFLEELCKYHVSGTLKVAPEHVSNRVLEKMRKPSREVFLAFSKKYKEINEKLGLKQYLIPYFISSHPGSTLGDAVELAVFLKKSGFVPDQVQDFYPTPGTLSTCMYYTEMDPFTGEKVYVAKDPEEKKMQRALMHFHKPENRDMVKKALEKANRQDLIPALLGKPGSLGNQTNSGNSRNSKNTRNQGNSKDTGVQRNPGKPGLRKTIEKKSSPAKKDKHT